MDINFSFQFTTTAHFIYLHNGNGWKWINQHDRPLSYLWSIIENSHLVLVGLHWTIQMGNMHNCFQNFVNELRYVNVLPRRDNGEWMSVLFFFFIKWRLPKMIQVGYCPLDSSVGLHIVQAGLLPRMALELCLA